MFASELPSESADFIISTFGLKTFNAEQHARLAALIARVLKPGGVFSMIEASDPKGWWLRPLYLFHFKFLLPLIERILLRGAQDFSMIGSYTSNFGSAEQLATMLREQGFEVEFRGFSLGARRGWLEGRERAISVNST
ncbi:MAG: class I SAM-dependent methyltransferase [bacterium]|nr:class I SAM-dependent methyltransferase [bacterium]